MVPNASMTFIEHVKELRKRLIVSLLAIMISTVVCFIVYDPIISIVYGP